MGDRVCLCGHLMTSHRAGGCAALVGRVEARESAVLSETCGCREYREATT